MKIQNGIQIQNILKLNFAKFHPQKISNLNLLVYKRNERKNYNKTNSHMFGFFFFCINKQPKKERIHTHTLNEKYVFNLQQIQYQEKYYESRS